MPLTITNFWALNYLQSLGLCWSRQPQEVKGQRGNFPLQRLQICKMLFQVYSRFFSLAVLWAGDITVKLLLTLFSYSPLIFSRKWLLVSFPHQNCPYYVISSLLILMVKLSLLLNQSSTLQLKILGSLGFQDSEFTSFPSALLVSP